jgi:hypothetical protein
MSGWVAPKSAPTDSKEAISFPDTLLKSQTTIPKFQIISKFQHPMAKTFQLLIRCLADILSVLNFEFRSFVFVWGLWFDAWNFHAFH